MKQTQWVLDASALLAAIHDEDGAEHVKPLIDRCVISSVNWSEVVQKLANAGVEIESVTHSLKALGLTIIDFTEEDANLAASLWTRGKKLGLSLADRACISTAIRLKQKILTADRVWGDLDLELSIHLIR